MDLQKLVDAMNEQDCITRAGYQMTLGGFIEALESAEPDLPVLFSDRVPVGKIDSYRGYYTDLAFEDGTKALSVGEWREEAQEALKTTFTGYKGGDYPATPQKPLWRSEYGIASEKAIVGHVVSDGTLILIEKKIP